MSKMWAALLLVATGARWMHAQEAPPAAPPATEAAAPDATAPVRQAMAAYVEAFNAHDAGAVAALWSATGTHVNKETGVRTAGRDALTASYAKLFKGSPEIVLSADPTEVRLVGVGVALVDGEATVVSPNAEPSVSAYSAIFVNESGKWLIDTIHESDVAVPETPRQALAPLEWMVGLWQDDSDTATVTSEMRWSPSEAFLIRSYDVDREGEAPFQGQQIIGWDPSTRQIRSWTFNSDGSFGEGAWSQNGAEWIVRKVETLSDGRLASGTQVITQIDADTITVQTIAKEIGGAPEPTAEPATMRRVVTVQNAEENATSAPSTPGAGR